MFTDSIMYVVSDPVQRKRIFWAARKLLPFTGARCATVWSLVYWAAKGENISKLKLRDLWPGTDQLDARLCLNGWARSDDYKGLIPGLACFTADWTGRRGAPDHVYTFVRWLDFKQGIAEIYDNYSPHLRPRNVRATGVYQGRRYTRTPFAYALYPPM